MVPPFKPSGNANDISLRRIKALSIGKIEPVDNKDFIGGKTVSTKSHL